MIDTESDLTIGDKKIFANFNSIFADCNGEQDLSKKQEQAKKKPISRFFSDIWDTLCYGGMKNVQVLAGTGN